MKERDFEQQATSNPLGIGRSEGAINNGKLARG